MNDFDPDGPAPSEAGVFGLSTSEADARVVLLPVPFEATVSYGGGAARGPEMILHASHQVDLFDVELGRPYEAGISMRPLPSEILGLNLRAKSDARAVIEVGGHIEGNAELAEALASVNAAGEAVNAYVYENTRDLIARGKIVGLIGGDHSTPFGAIRAHAEHWPGLGILHLDAHADLRHAYEGFEWSHASIMECVVRRIPEVRRIVQIGIRDVAEAEIDLISESNGRVQTWVDPLIARARLKGGLIDLFKEAVDALPEHVYLSFDIDGLDPRLCPNTGTPVPGGLDIAEVSVMLELVVESGRKIVGFDLVEVAGTSSDDEWDGNVGARMLYKMIGWTLRSQGLISFDHRLLWERLRSKNRTSRVIA